MEDSVIIKELKKVPQLERWLADKAYLPELPVSNRTEHRESYEHGVSDTFMYIRSLLKDQQ